MSYRYRPEILALLAGHGVVPTPRSDPRMVYEHVKSLYSFEIREMKLKRREAGWVLGEQPLELYRRQLRELQKRYPVLTLPPQAWVEEGSAGLSGEHRTHR